MRVIYSAILSFVEDVALLTPRIAHHDPDLARQLRRASTSAALNTSEGMYARGRSRTDCYNIALREMRESYAALESHSHSHSPYPLPHSHSHSPSPFPFPHAPRPSPSRLPQPRI